MDSSDQHCMFCTFVHFVGIIVVAKLAFSALSTLYKFFLRTPKNLRKYGEWAVVTGATDGIGLEYARQLAAKAINVVLISRSQEKLDATKDDIVASYGVQVETCAADLSDEAAYARIEALLRDLDVGILINNVGVSYEHPDYVENVDPARVDTMMTLNIHSVNKMTQMVLPGMKARKRGAIVNIGSASGINPTSLLTYYSASKSYVNFFSQALAYEAKKSGVFVQSCMPLFVVSKLSKIRKPSFFTPTPKTFVASALTTIGYDVYTNGFFPHALQLGVVSLVPAFIMDSVLFKMHIGLRKRALKKKAEKAEKGQ